MHRYSLSVAVHGVAVVADEMHKLLLAVHGVAAAAADCYFNTKCYDQSFLGIESVKNHDE